MRKKFTLLFASLLAFAGVAKADVTDLPEMSTEGDIKWYTISNTRSASGKYLYWTESGVKDSNTGTGASLFYVTGSADACYIHNYATDLLFSGAGSWTEAGVACKLSVSPLNTGLMIGFDGTYLNEQNQANGFTTWGDINDNGSVFVFEKVTDFSSVIDVAAAKTAAIAEIENYATVSTLYPAAIDAVAAVNAVTSASNGLKDLNDAVEAINAVVVDYRDKAYQALAGKNFTIQTLATDRSKGFMQMATSNVVGSAEAASPANIWQFVCNGNGTVNVYNPYTGKYLCEPQGNSAEVVVTTDKATAGAYVLNVNNNPAVAEAKVKLTSNGKSVHMAGGHTLVRWDNGGASEWQVTEVTDFSGIIALYKASAIATLDSWATLSVVFDADLIATAKTAIDGITTTDWATFAAVDAKLKNVTDKVAEKYFTFKNSDTANSARTDAYLAANASTAKGYGNKTFGYDAIWRLLSAGGTSFYLCNELNSAYLKNPSSGDLVADATQAATYTFEIIDAATNKAELKSGNETLHLSGGCALMNYDNDDAASRWYIATYDYKADLTALVNANKTNHAEEPALGQYSTAAYNALVEAEAKATTVAAVAEAIAAFKAALNMPVYFITSAWDEGYPAGSAIYYDGAWKWKAANKYDKQMWMTIPGYTKADVPVVDAYDANGTSYAICDYLTGTKMRGKDVQIVKIADWEGAYNLQYNADATSTDAVQHANGSNSIVNWKAATTTDCQASAWRIEYLGSSYELAELTDEYLAAGLELAALNVPAGINIAAGVNNYHEAEEGAVAAAKAKIAEVLVKFATAEEIAAAKAQFEAAIEGIAINQPEQGKYYRIRCTGEGMKRIQSTLADNDRLEMKSGDDGKNEGSIFLYTEGGLKSYSMSQFIDAYSFVAVGEDVPQVTFSAAANGKTGCYNIKIGDRYIFGAGDTIDSGEATDDRDGYNWWLEEIAEEELPEDPTGVERVVVEEATVIYDLLGRRVEKMEKGIYIVNGKKVLVK